MDNTISTRIRADRRGVLSSLWIFVLFNMLFRDIHEFARPGWIEELMTMEVAEGLLLVSGMVLSLFISMIVLSRVLPFRAARWANLAVSVLAIAAMLANLPGDLDDTWFFAIEILALLAVIGIAWTWRADPAERSLDPVITNKT
ncbi:MAG: DUF6326 family protein [Acidimicrobiia bacterium]|nr:DUF6326 family protein [Acidimicrobiia bacterium]MDH5505278.1 DUF6326 family protein [Acidimicrobiia bacterium]